VEKGEKLGMMGGGCFKKGLEGFRGGTIEMLLWI